MTTTTTKTTSRGQMIRYRDGWGHSVFYRALIRCPRLPSPEPTRGGGSGTMFGFRITGEGGRVRTQYPSLRRKRISAVDMTRDRKTRRKGRAGGGSRRR